MGRPVEEVCDATPLVIETREAAPDESADTLDSDLRAEQAKPPNVFQIVAFLFCMAFGLLLIANVQPTCEGMWFWYSHFFLEGKHLYADMHLALQPLYVLETSGFMAVLGKGWIASRVPAVMHLTAYCLALLLLVRQANLSDALKAILLTCSFFLSIAFPAIVFSDYHILADCFMLYSVVLLLSLKRSSNVRRTLVLAVILGSLSGLTLTTRLNDGAVLFLGTFLAIVCLAPGKRLLSLLLFSVSTGFTGVLIVSLTGDSFRDYAINSIFRAAGVKGGGGGSVLSQPFLLPWNTLKWFVHPGPIWMFIHAFVASVILLFLLRPLSRKRGWWQIGLAAFGIILIGFHAHRMGILMENGVPASLGAFLVVLAYALAIRVLAKCIFWGFGSKWADTWDRREILLLIRQR